MHHPSTRPHISILALTCYALLLPAAASAGPVSRVLVVGDSWADLMWQDRVLRTVFAGHGLLGVVEEGDATAISGSTAAEWATPSMLQLITDQLDAFPTIDTVQLTVGGNDFLAGQSGGGWYAGIPPAVLEALFTQILADAEVVLDHILAYDPGIEVVISLYDYPNFVETLSGPLAIFCGALWFDLGQTTAFEINTAGSELEDRVEALVATKPRTAMVRHNGSMQWRYGFPGMGIPPGQLEPPGDLTLPSPIEAMRFQADCFHLGTEGYLALAENLWQGYYRQRFTGAFFADGFESGDTLAWSLTDP